MNIFLIIRRIWKNLVGIFGTVFMAMFLISIIVAIIEKAGYRKKIKSKGKSKEGACRKIAVITGASSGIGRGYAKAIDKNPEKYDVTEIWLIARRRERLEALASELKLPVKILCLDLTDPESLDEFEDTLAKEAGGTDSADAQKSFSITMLLNCAGYGRYGSSSEIGRREENRMIEVNDQAAISITSLTVPYMHAGSRILEVCSVAGFQPIPFFNAYAASKALLYSYSRALRVELMKSGISVTAVCPYWVRDTEFIEKAAGEKRKMFLSTTTANVVRVSLRDLQHRHALSTPGFLSTLDRIFSGLIPDELLCYIMTRFL